MKDKENINRDEVLACYKYEPLTGEVERLRKVGRFTAGTRVGTKTTKGYLQITWNYFSYPAHRFIWFMVNGYWPEIVDHINGIKTDNRLENLRDCSYRLNNSNTKKHREGHLVGTSYVKKKKVWISTIHIRGRRKYLGSFKTAKQAHQAYIKEKTELLLD